MLFKFVFRNFKKRLVLNLIKIIGLALGLGGILFITLFLKNELTYDQFHTKADRIYRFTITNQNFFNNQHFARISNSEEVPELASYFPEIENYVRLSEIKGGVVMYKNENYTINKAFVTDSTFFNIFDAALLAGNKNEVLNAPASMVVSSSFAKKVFGNSDPIGAIITLPAGQYYPEAADFMVKGVMEDFPQNSHFHPDLITTPAKGKITSWAYSYLLLKNKANPDHITSGYSKFLADHYEEAIEANESKAHLQTLTDIHLHSNKLREIEPNGSMTNVYVLSIAAFILLIISLTNYASLNLGMAAFNHKFITLNRMLGSTSRITLKYFLIEGLFIVLLSIILATVIAIPAQIFIKNSFNVDLFFGNEIFIFMVISFVGFLGMLAGLQPVFKQYIGAKFDRGRNLNNANKVAPNKGIIIIQYSFAIALFIAVIVITRQTNFALENSLGAEGNDVICFESVHSDVQEKFEVFKSELLKHESIEQVSAMLDPPGGETNDMFEFILDDAQPPIDGENPAINLLPCDYSFANLFGLSFLSGENFSQKNKDVDGSGEYIINETAMRFMNFNNPDELIGKKFQLLSPIPDITLPEGKIIGVVKDFHLSNVKRKVEPLVLFKRSDMWLLNFVISYKPELRTAALEDVKSVWANMFPAYPVAFENVNAMYRDVYKIELLQSKLLSLFTVISIFISSIGLLGMSLLISRQRIKEIGVRKVNGAQIGEIMTLLNRNFIKWVFIAFIMAIPIAYFAMNKWLENFAYKTDMNWWIFALAGLSTLLIVVLTVSWQSFKAAIANPVDALKNE